VAGDDHQRRASRLAGRCVISDLGVAGLPATSIVRPAKTATIDAEDADRLGRLPDRDRARVRDYVRERLADLG
jgi:mRNA interferase MazF